MRLFALMTGLEVVFSGEHYMMDVFAGVLAAGLFAMVVRFDAHRFFSRLSAWASTLRRLARLPRPPLFQPVGVRSERGQALIEMILVLPLIFVFILVLVDFGIAIDRRQVIQHAVRDGARQAAVGLSAASVKTYVNAQSQGLIDVANVEVCYVDGPDPGTSVGNAGDGVRVSATYTYQFSMGGGEMLTVFGVPVPSITMTPEAEMRLERSVAGATACTS
jgi:competence protein ComGC